jgi:low temperature requirement protein LtrA
VSTPLPAADGAPGPGAGGAGHREARDRAGPPDGGAGPQPRVTTIELFFDLVFAFTLTQLTALLADEASLAALAQVLLIFTLIWWMYAGYAWLTNTRPPVRSAERLLLLVGMAGLLIVGLAIPAGFSSNGVPLGLGYLVVVLVHATLYFRVNRNILRIAPFSIASALLIIAAGIVSRPDGEHRPAAYALWILAVVIQLGSPLVVHPRGLFGLRPAHIVERHTALVIVALGESGAAVGIGASRLANRVGGMTAELVAVSLLGLALSAALWWTLFGGNEDQRAERALAGADSSQRTSVILNAYFYAHTPLLLGIVAVAAGIEQAIAHTAAPPSAGSAAAAISLAAGTAALLAGDVAFRRLLRIGRARLRMAGAAAAAATVAAGLSAGLPAQLALLTAILAAVIVAEQRLEPPAGNGWARAPADDVAAG